MIFRSDGRSAFERDGPVSSDDDDDVLVAAAGRAEKGLVMGKGLLANSWLDGDESDSSDARSRRKARNSASAASSRFGGGRGWASSAGGVKEGGSGGD